MYLKVLIPILSTNGAVGGLACEHASEVCACPCTKQIATKKPPVVAIGAGIGVSAGAAIAGAAALYMFLQSRKAAGQAAELTADTLLVNAYVLGLLVVCGCRCWECRRVRLCHGGVRHGKLAGGLRLPSERIPYSG